jgi:phosphoribosylcarboxyaminoimidazole (NCAIR) mutase
MSTPVTIADEKRAITEQWSALLLKVQQEDREVTEEEQKQLDGWDADMKALTVRQQSREKTAELLRRFAPSPAAPLAPAGHGRVALPGDGASVSGDVALKSLGRQFVESAGFAEFKAAGGPRGGTWATPIIELKAPTLPPTYALSGTGILQGTMIQPLPPVMPSMLSLLATGTTDGGVIYYLREQAWTNNAAVVAPGAAKPESPKTFEYVQQALVKLAHWVAIADEMFEDVSSLETFINTQMARGVLQKLEDQVLNGSGTGGQMTGLLTATTQSVAAGVPLSAAFLSAIATIQAQGYQPNGIVVNPLDFALIVGESAPNAGYYLGPGAFQDTPALRLWGVPVVGSNQMPAGTGLVGAFGQGAILYRKDGVSVQASNSHTDYFIKNITTIRAEIRAALAVLNPAAFCEVTGIAAP